MILVGSKPTKEAARYTDAGGRERCSACRWFYPQGTCGRIAGPVSPRGWCKYFSQELVYNIYQPSGNAGQGAGAASLDIGFYGPPLDPRITFTRASTATYFDSGGVMQTAAINAPRFDYDPVTLQLRGLLIEEARTNVLLNSAILGTQSVAVTAQAYTLSFYGTGTITKSGTATGALVGTGASPQRVSQTFTPTAGTLTLTVSGSVLNAQLEAGAFPTSQIPTAAATVTRAADVATMPTAAWFNATTGSLAVTGSYGAVAIAAYAPAMAELDDGTQNNLIGIRIPAASAVMQGMVFVANAATAVPSPAGTFTAFKPDKAAISYNYTGNLVIAALNGQTTSINASSMPAGINRLLLGAGRSNTMNGWLSRVTYWNRALSNAELQTVTT